MIIVIIITTGNLVFITQTVALGWLSPPSCAYRHTMGGTSVCIWLSLRPSSINIFQIQCSHGISFTTNCHSQSYYALGKQQHIIQVISYTPRLTAPCLPLVSHNECSLHPRADLWDFAVLSIVWLNPYVCVAAHYSRRGREYCRDIIGGVCYRYIRRESEWGRAQTTHEQVWLALRSSHIRWGSSLKNANPIYTFFKCPMRV